MLLILLLVNLSLLTLYSQTSPADNGGEVASLDEIRNAIEEERITQVNELLRANNISGIEDKFAEDEEAYFTLIKENDREYSNFIRSMMFKAYRNIASLQDDLLFLDCKKAVYSQDWDMVTLKANDLVRRYPDSNRKDVTIRYWKLALFKSGKDQEYVELVEEYPEFELASQKFRYGQSLYNIGRFADAQKYLEEAAIDTEYTLRSTATLALISLSEGRIEEATAIFDVLQNNFSPDTPYYDFVLLSIARLFSHYGDPETAVSYYQAYSQLNNDNISEVIYEIGIAHRKAGNLQKAKTTFERLLESKNANDFYVQTLYNLILIDQELNNGDSASNLMTSYQARVDDYFTSLLQNRNLMNEIRSLRNNLLMETEETRKNILREQITSKEEAVLANQLVLEEKISFLDPRSVQLIKELELTFIERTETYFVELDLIDQYRNRPKDELIAIANRDRANKEEDYLLDITEELLSEIESPNDDQFLRAYWYANQLYLKKKYIVNLSNLVDKTRSYPQKNSELRQLLKDEQENLDEIRVKAKFDLAEFPNLSEKQELAEEKVEEFLAQESKLEVKRRKVIDTYYETVAAKAEAEVKDKFKELDGKISIYSNSFNKFNQIKNEQQTYVDFIALDLDFRKINENYKKRLEEADRDSLALSEAEYGQYEDQYESIYNRTNAFIFKNNNFNNNFKLYFNLAEIATIIYSNNYNLIYNNYQKVLELNPDFPQKDVVLYNLAYYKNQILDLEIANLREEMMKDENYFYQPRPESVTKSVSKYREVIDNYLELSKDVNSKYQIESMLRLAKLYFDIAVDADDPAKYVGISIKVYDQIYALGSLDQKYEALFQRAWHKMAIQNYEAAIADLEILLADKDMFTEYQKNKYSAAEDIIVYSLNEVDYLPNVELKSKDYVMNKLFTLYDESTANNIFQKLLEKKRIFDEFEDIITLYDARSRVDLYAITNPVYTDSIITTMSRYSLELGDSLDIRGEREYRKAIARYGYTSDWYEYNKNQDLSPYVRVIQKGFDDFILPDLYSKVDANPNMENIMSFTNATEEYANYVGFDEEIRAQRLKIYDQNNISAIVKYVRSQQDTTAYNYGIEKVYNFIDRNPETDIRTDLEQNAYSWAYNVSVITDTTNFDTLNYSTQEIEDIKSERRSQYISIANRFYDFLSTSDIPDKDQTIYKLLYYRGLTKRRMGDNDGAKADFLACNDLNISDEYKESIFRNLAELYKADGDIDSSIEYFAKAKEFVDDEKKTEYEKEIFNNRSAKISQLQSTDNQEDKVKAAQEMEKVLQSSVIDEAKKAELRRNAIALYAAGGDYDTAVSRLLEQGDASKTIEEAWNNYSAAISITDSLGYKERTQEIEDTFMGRFPNDQQTFVILISRLGVVQDSTLTTYDPLLASEKMLEIYERASQEGDKLDISSLDLKAEDYYFNAIEMKCRTLSKEDKVQEWVAFNLKFPDYERIYILNLICSLYEELEDDENYLEYIKILYATDNTSVRYPRYAVEQLSPIDEEIKKAYRNKEWDRMLSLIEDFKAQAETFTANGIPAETIAIPSSLERYDKYTLDYEREQEKKAFLADLEIRYNKFMEFIDVPAEVNERIKVNNATTWNTHLYGDNKRINNFVELVKNQFALIDQDAQRVFDSDLLTVDEKREEIYKLDYAKFKIAKYSGDLIYNQITKFLTLPNGQYVNYQNIIYGRTDLTYDEQDEILYAYEDEIYLVRGQYATEFDNIGIGYAKSIYETYIDGITNPLPGTDEIVAFLQKVGVSEVVAKEEIEIPFLASMRKDFSAIQESEINDGYRDFMIYTIPSGDSLHIETSFECPILPMASRIRFVEEGDFWFNDQVSISFKANDNLVDISNLYLPDGIIEDSLSAFPYLYRGLSNDNNLASLNYSKGQNTISLQVVNKSFDDINIGFNFAMIYDKEKLFIHNNAVKFNLVTDNTWLGADSLETLTIDDPNWGQVSYGTIDEDYYQLDAFKNSVAIPIWYRNTDLLQEETKQVDTNNLLTDLNIQDTLSAQVLEDSLMLANTGLDSLNVASLADSTMLEEEVIEDQPTVKYFVKEFEVTGQVIDSIIYFLANETVNIYLNGQQVGFEEYYYFAPPDAPYLDISPDYYVQGKNVIIFEVNSPKQDNGLLIDLQIRTLNERR
jgi:tetratricopeptide (TPR) repeat protein